MADLLVRDARLVPLADDPSAALPPTVATGQGGDGLVDLVIRDGQVAEVAPAGSTVQRSAVLEAAGRWVMPGLWDQHVHFDQWALASSRLDLGGTTSVAQATALVADRLASDAPPPAGMLIGFGHRPARWHVQPTVAALDAVTAAVPVVLISGDAHHGWLNSAALRALGQPPREGVVAEAEWFALYDRITTLPGGQQAAEEAVTPALRQASSRGIVGIVDLEFATPWESWPRRYADAVPPVLRVRTGVYPGMLRQVLDRGHRTGDLLDERGLVQMGPLKIITDGSLNTRTAWCCEPYADGHLLEDPRGAPNLPAQEIREHVTTAVAAGLEVALHAIGDAAVASVLDLIEAAGARGSVEHAQLMRLSDIPRWAGLPVRASVQPAHLLDDRGVTEQCWPDRAGRTFPLAPLLAAGVPLALGSDAPVAMLDPWLTIAAAVHRGPIDGESWHPELALTPHQALAASVDGQRVRPGARGDIVLLDECPYVTGDSAAQAAHLLATRVSATVLAGEVVAGG